MNPSRDQQLPPDGPALFESRSDAEKYSLSAAVVPSPNKWNDFGFAILADIGLRSQTGKMTWFAGRFAIRGVRSLAEFTTANLTKRLRWLMLSSLDEPYACLFNDVRSYSLTRRALGVETARIFLTQLHDIALLNFLGQPVPGWDKFFSSDVFTRSFVRSSESYSSYRTGGEILLGRQTSAADACQAFSARLRGRGPRIDLDFAFDRKNLLRGRIAVLVGPNGTGKTSSLANLARGLADTRARTIQFDPRPDLNQVLVFAHSSVRALFVNRNRESGSARVRVLPIDPLPAKKVNRESDTQLLVDLARADEDSEPRLAVFEEVLAQILPGFRIRVPLQGENRYVDLGYFQGETEQHRLDAIGSVDVSQKLRVEAGDAGPRKPSLGQVTFFRFLLYSLAYAGQASVLLVDEPENFMHPNFISRFMQVLHRVLSATKSIAIVATHSPFVVREVQSALVHILQHANGESIVRSPLLQTLGANVADISDEVFGDDLPDHLHSDLLREAQIENLAISEILERYSKEISTEALIVLRARKPEAR